MPVLAMSVLWWIFLVCMLMGLGFWMLFAWSVRAGQFDDFEQAAREMLEHERDEFAPAAYADPVGATRPEIDDQVSGDRVSGDRVSSSAESTAGSQS